MASSYSYDRSALVKSNVLVYRDTLLYASPNLSPLSSNDTYLAKMVGVHEHIDLEAVFPQNAQHPGFHAGHCPPQGPRQPEETQRYFWRLAPRIPPRCRRFPGWYWQLPQGQSSPDADHGCQGQAPPVGAAPDEQPSWRQQHLCCVVLLSVRMLLPHAFPRTH